MIPSKMKLKFSMYGADRYLLVVIFCSLVASLSGNLEFLFVAWSVSRLILILFEGAKETTPSTSTIKISTSSEMSETDTEQFKMRSYECNIHENCTSRLFSLDTYCCKPANYCCNWIEFMMKFK